MSHDLIPRTPETAPALAWLDAYPDSREGRFFKRLLVCQPAQMDATWTTYYGWSEVWRWFPSDAFIMDGQPTARMDIPRFLVEYMQTGVRRDVSGCIDFPSRRLALEDLATAFVRWLAREMERRAAMTKGA